MPHQLFVPESFYEASVAAGMLRPQTVHDPLKPVVDALVLVLATLWLCAVVRMTEARGP